MVELDQLVSAGCAVIPRGSRFEGELFDAFKDFAEAGKQHGGLMIGQVCHPGR